MKTEECEWDKLLLVMLKLIEWNEEILLQLILQERGSLTRAEARKNPFTLRNKEHLEIVFFKPST